MIDCVQKDADDIALMEYHSNKDQGVAVRIFELGFKSFPDSPDFIVRYVQFLLSVNDDNSRFPLGLSFRSVRVHIQVDRKLTVQMPVHCSNVPHSIYPQTRSARFGKYGPGTNTCMGI